MTCEQAEKGDSVYPKDLKVDQFLKVPVRRVPELVYNPLYHTGQDLGQPYLAAAKENASKKTDERRMTSYQYMNAQRENKEKQRAQSQLQLQVRPPQNKVKMPADTKKGELTVKENAAHQLDHDTKIRRREPNKQPWNEENRT